MNTPEKQNTQKPLTETSEVIRGGRYSVATVRVMAGIPHEKIRKPVEELDVNYHKERLKTIKDNELGHRHIVDISTQERLRDSKARIDFPSETSEEQKARIIADRNREWREDVLNWLDTVPESVANAVDRVYHINKKDRVAADQQLEKLRAEVFDVKGPAGEADINSIVTDFVREYDETVDGGLPLSEGVVKKDLEEIKPFLYIFGGEKTVTRLEHAILATAALLNAPVGSEEREKLVAEVSPLLEMDIEPENAKHFTPFDFSDEVVEGINIGGDLVHTAEPAPIDETIADVEEDILPAPVENEDNDLDGVAGGSFGPPPLPEDETTVSEEVPEERTVDKETTADLGRRTRSGLGDQGQGDEAAVENPANEPLEVVAVPVEGESEGNTPQDVALRLEPAPDSQTPTISLESDIPQAAEETVSTEEVVAQEQTEAQLDHVSQSLPNDEQIAQGQLIDQRYHAAIDAIEAIPGVRYDSELYRNVFADRLREQGVSEDDIPLYMERFNNFMQRQQSSLDKLQKVFEDSADHATEVLAQLRARKS